MYKDNVLNALLNDADMPLDAELLNDLYHPEHASQHRDQVIAELSEDNSAIFANDGLYGALRFYLVGKIFDHYPLNPAEEKLVQLYPELDDTRIIRVPVTDALFDKAVEHPELLTDDEFKAIRVVLIDKLYDGELLEEQSDYMMKIFDFIFKHEDISLVIHEAEKIKDKVDNYDREYAILEFGYDIYDPVAAQAHIEQIQSQGIPISQREARIIAREHGINSTVKTDSDN